MTTATYIDATPLVRALREKPGDFRITESYEHVPLGGDFSVPRLRHIPTEHDFVFKRGLFRDSVGIPVNVRCDCSRVRTAIRSQFSRADQRKIWAAYRFWYSSYWQPMAAFEANAEKHRIDRQFADHFNLGPKPVPAVRPSRALPPFRLPLGAPQPAE